MTQCAVHPLNGARQEQPWVLTVKHACMSASMTMCNRCSCSFSPPAGAAATSYMVMTPPPPSAPSHPLPQVLVAVDETVWVVDDSTATDHPLPLGCGGVLALAVSPDGAFVALQCGDSKLRVMASGEEGEGLRPPLPCPLAGTRSILPSSPKTRTKGLDNSLSPPCDFCKKARARLFQGPSLCFLIYDSFMWFPYL
jgi:hypothetical protein